MMVKNKISAILNLTEDAEALRPLTNHRPVAALPFAGRYRVIDFALSNVSHAGIDSVAIFIGDSGRSIYDHVRSGESWDLNNKIRGGIFTFSQQNWKKEHHAEDETEDFYYNQRLFLERSKTDYVFVSGSNVIANIDIQQVCQQHIASGKELTMIYAPLTEEQAKENVNNVIIHIDENEQVKVLDDNQVATTERVDVSLNMYVLKVSTLINLMNDALKDEVYEDVDSLIEQSLEKLSVNAYEYTGFSAQIHSINSYYNANMAMLNRSNFSALFYSSIPILTKAKNGSPTYYDAASNVKSSILGSDCSIYGEVKDSILNRRVTVGAGAVVKDSNLLQGVTVGEGARVEYAIIDKDSIIDPGAEVIGTPDNYRVIAKHSHIKA